MHQLLAVTSVLVALCSLGSVDSSAYDKIVSHSRIRARKEGPNVCALQQVLGTKKKYFSTCRNWYKGTICGKKAMVVYECCPGYMKLEGMRGCPAVAPIDHVYGTLGLVKASITQQYSDISKVRTEIEGQGSFTMFAPSDDAWNLLPTEVRSALVSNVNVELYNALHYHMVNRRLLTKDMKDGLTVQSMYVNQDLFINHYSNGVVTVNCARIIHGNQVATNGVVHVIDRVISVVNNNIRDFLELESDFSSFAAAALASGVMDKLDKPGHFTLFAPNNDAFDKLSPGYLEKIMSNKEVIAALVNYHLLNTVQCSEAIMSGMEYETAEGTNIQIGCDGDYLTVNGIKMVLKKDIVTTNGVIHVIDQILVPNSAKEVMDLVGDKQSTFVDMVSELGLAEAMGAKTQYTILPPPNNVFTNEVMTTDQDLLKIILENHILKLKIKLSELYNGQLLETLAGKMLRVFIYRTAVCIENACMMRGSKEGSNGVFYPMNGLIRPTEKSMYELLVADGRFKIFLSLMEIADLTDLLKQEGSFTVFAPTDDAFGILTHEDMLLLKRDINALRTILLYHFSNGVFINGGLEGGVTNLLKTLQGNNLQVMAVNNSIHVNSVDVPDGDLMATNGVVHVVKNVLYPGDLPVGRQDFLALLQKLIRYIQIKFVSGFSYKEIPLTFIKRTYTTTTHYIETVPEVKKLTRVIGGDTSSTKVTKVTKVVEADPTITKVTRVIGGDTSSTRVTKLTKVVEADPTITKVTRVIGGHTYDTEVTKVVEAEPTITKVTRVIGGDRYGTKVIEGDASIIKVTGVVEGEPVITKVTRVIESEPTVGLELERDPGVRKYTRIIEEKPSSGQLTTGIHSVGDPAVTKYTRVIEGGEFGTEGKRIRGGGRITTVSEPHVIEGPDFSRITTIHGDPSLVNEESERITKLIKEGGRTSAARRGPVGVRRTRLVRRHHRPRVSSIRKQ